MITDSQVFLKYCLGNVFVYLDRGIADLGNNISKFHTRFFRRTTSIDIGDDNTICAFISHFVRNNTIKIFNANANPEVPVDFTV